MSTTEDSSTDINPQQDDAGQSPEEAVDLLEKSSTKTVDDPGAPTESDKNAYSGYMGELKREQEVHSYSSLQDSREYVLTLLHLPSESSKSELIAASHKQEMSLQESIRLKSYEDAEFTVKMRRFLTYMYTWGMIGIVTVLIFIPLLAGVLGHPIDANLFRSLTIFASSTVVAGAVAMRGFFTK